MIIGSENFGREENLSPVLIPTVSKDRDEQIKLAHRVVDILDQASGKISVNLLRSNVKKPQNQHAQVRLFAKKKEDEKCQQIGRVK